MEVIAKVVMIRLLLSGDDGARYGAGSSDTTQQRDGGSGTGGGNREIATDDADGGLGTGGSDDGGSGTQRVDWQWQTGHRIELHKFIQLIVIKMLMI